MATQFVPLTAKLIQEGAFLENIDTELSSIQKALIDFVKEHEQRSEKAEATLQISIKLRVESAEDQAYSITTGMKSTVPKRPTTVSLAIGGTSADDADTLFVRQEGSDETTPVQGKLFKTHGKDPTEA